MLHLYQRYGRWYVLYAPESLMPSAYVKMKEFIMIGSLDLIIKRKTKSSLIHVSIEMALLLLHDNHDDN